MRPVRLEIQGFTCYREKQEIDFRRLGLFAIAGPTGAGKSSILDAIAFALYGKIPRMGSQNLDEFISLGAARASVLFEFDVKNERFRVVRTMPRSGPKKVQLELISNGLKRPLADTVGDVNAHLHQLLGLEYEAFIQSVLLPQGEFSRFLKSKPHEQRQILRELLRLGIYERMRERAFALAKDLANAINRDRELLNGFYAQATPHNVLKAELELEDLKKRCEIATRHRDECREVLTTMRAQWKLVEECQLRQTRLQKLGEDQARIDQLMQAIERAKRAAEVAPVLKQAAARFESCQTAEQALKALEREMMSATKEMQDLDQKMAEVQQRADTLPAKRSRAIDLSAIQPIAQERQSLSTRAEQARLELAECEKAIKDGKARLERTEPAVVRSREKVDLLGQERKQIGYDAATHAIFKNTQRLAYDLSEARRQVASLNPEAVQATVRSADAELKSAQAKTQTAQAEYAKEEEQARAAQLYLEAVQEKNKAASLRANLMPGCTCPVCEQQVRIVPPAELPTDLANAKSAAAKSKKTCDAAREQLEKAREVLTRSEANFDNVRKNATTWEEQGARYRNRVDDFSASLIVAIKPFDCPGGVSPDEFVEQELARLEILHSAWQSIGEKLNGAHLEFSKAVSERDVAKIALQTDEKTKLRLKGEITDAERKLADYDVRIRAVSSADPEKDLKALQKDIADIEKQYGDVSKRRDTAREHAHKLELKVSSMRAQVHAAERERDESQISARKALREANFADPAEVDQAGMNTNAIVAEEKRIAAFEEEVRQTRARVRELGDELAGVNLKETDVQQANERAESGEAEVSRLERNFGSKSKELERLKSDTENAEALRREHEQRRSRHSLLNQLSKDLRGDSFQQYLLEGSFRRLVAGASNRLRELNERYELAFIDGNFAVIDHDHGSLSRLADTLSGGETFLVSLALALELSEQVQQAAGAVRLDSLFIDEGFGTLDPETLETVADAIEGLSNTNRMVGVITHVAELHRRLPRIEVRPTPSGSTINYVED